MQSETSSSDAVKNAVFQEIERQSGVDPNTLKVIRMEPRIWSNGCLDLEVPGEMCTLALVPGWIVEVEGNNQLWVYHTDRSGNSVRQASGWSERREGDPVPK
jgi:hypothetical protein